MRATEEKAAARRLAFPLLPENEAILKRYELSLTGKAVPTVRRYTGNAESFLRFLGETPLAGARSFHVLTCLQEQADKWQDATVAMFLRDLRGFLVWSVKERIIGDRDALDAALGVTWRAPKPQPPVAKAEEVEALLKVTAGPGDVHDRTVILLLAHLGLRRGEVAGLRWEDINWNAPTVTILGKGRKRRELPITSQELFDAIDALRAQYPRGVYVVGRNSPKRPCVDVPKIAVERACAKAGIRRLNPHSFRHFWAHWAAESGVPITAVSEALGHSNVGITDAYVRGLGSVERLRRAFGDAGRPGGAAGAQ